MYWEDEKHATTRDDYSEITVYQRINKIYGWCSCAALSELRGNLITRSSLSALIGISLTQLLDGKRKDVKRWVGSMQASCLYGDPSFRTMWWLSNIFKLANRSCSCQLLFVSFEISSQRWNNRYSMLRLVVNILLILDLFVCYRGW